MDLITLSNVDAENIPLKATFCPERGMNLLSYTRGDIEVIDQSTRDEYIRRFAGFGPLIGPHFHTHTKYSLPKSIDPSLFPHIKALQAQGKTDYFSHGIARYAPWKYVHSSTQIKGELHGKDEWNGVPLHLLEGQDFSLRFEARLLSSGLCIRYEIESERPSVIGLHYYYSLVGKQSYVQSHVHNSYNDQGTIRSPLPPGWARDTLLHYTLGEATDFGFYPLAEEEGSRVQLYTGSHMLNIVFATQNEKEMLFQVYSPKGASFCCVEPITAHEPRSPHLHHSLLECQIEIQNSH